MLPVVLYWFTNELFRNVFMTTSITGSVSNNWPYLFLGRPILLERDSLEHWVGTPKTKKMDCFGWYKLPKNKLEKIGQIFQNVPTLYWLRLAGGWIKTTGEAIIQASAKCPHWILFLFIFTSGESPTFMLYSFWREVARSQPYWFSGVPQVHWNPSHQCRQFHHLASLLSCLSHLRMNGQRLCRGVHLWHQKLCHSVVICSWMEQGLTRMTLDRFPGSLKSRYNILSVFRL